MTYSLKNNINMTKYVIECIEWWLINYENNIKKQRKLCGAYYFYMYP